MAIDIFTEESIICDKTAYKYYRTPPRFLEACPPLHLYSRDPRYYTLRKEPLVTEVLGTPLHVITDSAQKRSHGVTLRFHVIDRELLRGCIRETLHGFHVASPELTLFTLSRTLTFNQLVMAKYEMCGRFTLYEPSEALSNELFIRHATDVHDGWSCVSSEDGKPSKLWTRPPLTNLSTLRDFAARIKGVRGHKLFERALDCVSGMTASPLEAQISMLLWMDPALGGQGYQHFENNYLVKYSHGAGILTGKPGAEIDLRVVSPAGTREWMLECQGKIVHDRVGAGTKDALRATALQAMGHGVTLITSDQLRDQHKFAVLLMLLSEKLGIVWPNKTSRQLIAENNLRADIFGDWLGLTREPTAQELKKRRLDNKARRKPGHFTKRKKATNGSGKDKNTQMRG